MIEELKLIGIEIKTSDLEKVDQKKTEYKNSLKLSFWPLINGHRKPENLTPKGRIALQMN